MSRRQPQLSKPARPLLKVGAATASAILIAWAVLVSGNSAPVRQPASEVVTAVLPMSGDLLFQPEAGQRYVYSFRRKIEVSGLGSNIPTVTYDGKLNLDVIATTTRGFKAIAQAQVDEYSGPEAPLVQVELDREGKKLKLQIAPSKDEEIQQYVAITKDLLSLWSFNTDIDTLGQYSFRAEELPSVAGARVLKKTKIKYLTQPQTEIVNSTHWLRWDSALSLPAEVKGEESTRLGQSGATLDSRASYHLKFSGKTASAGYTKAQLAKLNQTEGLQLNAMANDQRTHAKIDWNALVAKLARLNSMTSGERLAAFGELTQLLRQQPEMLGRVLALLSGKEIHQGADSHLFKSIVGALATAGTPEAQKALLSLYQNPEAGISAKGIILTAFTTTQASPANETLDFFRAEMEQQTNKDLAQGASYALGSGLQQASGKSAEQGMRALRQQWQNAVGSGDLSAQLSVLDAIGNSGRAEFFPDMQTLVESGTNIDLRAKATFAVRFMDATGKVALLSATLADRNEHLREASVKAISLAQWSEQFRGPLQSCSSHEAVAHIQKECDELLSAHSQLAGQ